MKSEKVTPTHPEMENQNQSPTKRGKLEFPPSLFVPTLYFVEGLPYTMVNLMSVVFYKNLQANNEFIGLVTSLLYIPWIIKLLWAPVVDVYATRRQWILISHAVLGAIAGLLAFSMFSLQSQAIYVTLALFTLMAFVSATQDIAIDGFYLDSLNRQKQALFVGIRNAAYKVSTLVGSGALVYVAGRIAETQGNTQAATFAGWAFAFAICAALFFVFLQVHAVFLPHPRQISADDPGSAVIEAEAEVKQKVETSAAAPAGALLSAAPAGQPHTRENRPRLTAGKFWEVFRTFFTQPGIVVICIYILTFRLGDALMLKMAQPFLLDPREKGGIGISTADVGLIYGTIGTTFLFAGGIFGGWLISKKGLKRWLLPTAIIQNSAILLYWGLAIFKPGVVAVAVVNAFEQFAYGLGTAAYTTFLLTIVKAEFKASHYATATALMALGMMLPGMVSGYLTTWLGYQNFFLLSFFAAIPGMITIFFLPIKEDEHEPLPAKA